MRLGSGTKVGAGSARNNLRFPLSGLFVRLITPAAVALRSIRDALSLEMPSTTVLQTGYLWLKDFPV
jgi:hypothetical protein